MKRLAVLSLVFVASCSFLSAVAAEDDGKLRIIAFGAHPDDCEFQMAGTAVKWAQLGHHVKLVSVTNGDIGHWREAGGPLAKRRTAEVHEAARRIGTTAEVLDIHDGELLPTLDNRQKITRLIREWDADLVIAHRPNDYHPDHRYTGVLGSRFRLHGCGALLLSRHAAAKTEPGLHVLPGQFSKA